MNALYWFALVVGAGMYLFSLFADFTGHGDVDGHGDTDFHAGDHHHGGEAFKILSLRNATYFLFAFGVTGVGLNWLWGGGRGLLTALLALFLGTVGAGISGLAFGWLRKTDSGDLPGDSSWIGAQGHVTIPLSAGGTGKILVTRGNREHELLARPFDEEAGDPQQWAAVMVVEMRNGIALVAPNDSSLGGPDLPALGSTSET
jgi:hypothetical protein